MKHGRLKSEIRKYEPNNCEIFFGSEAFSISIMRDNPSRTQKIK